MDRFVSTFTNRIDAKGRISVPAPFRAVLQRDPFGSGEESGIYCYPALDARALDAGGARLAKKIDDLLRALPDYSDERDQLALALYGEVQVLKIDGDGRIVLPEKLREHAGLVSEAVFVGMGDKFQIWAPEPFAAYRAAAREKVDQHRKLFGAGGRSRSGDGGGEGGARE
jgi:MraZ protein